MVSIYNYIRVLKVSCQYKKYSAGRYGSYKRKKSDRSNEHSITAHSKCDLL